MSYPSSPRFAALAIAIALACGAPVSAPPAHAAKIEQPIRALELGAVQVLDADGRPVALGGN